MKLTFGLHIDPDRIYNTGDSIYFTATDVAKYPGLKNIWHTYFMITNIRNNLVELDGQFWVRKYVFDGRYISVKRL